MSRRPYERELPKTWWLRQPRYVRYMMREMSAFFIGAYILLLIVALSQLAQGKAAYEAFLAIATGPVEMLFAFVTLLFAIYHSVTWFQVTPKAMPLMLAGKRIPGALIIAAHWFGFAVFGAALWLLVGS